MGQSSFSVPFRSHRVPASRPRSPPSRSAISRRASYSPMRSASLGSSRLCLGSLWLSVTSVWSLPPSPPTAPLFSKVDSLSRPASALPSEPVLASDPGSVRGSNATTGGGANAINSAGGSSSQSQSGAATTNDEWAGIRKLFQRALPFIIIAFVVCCACGGCCCCYLVYRRATRPQPPAPFYGPGHQFVFPAGGGTLGPYPPCHTNEFIGVPPYSSKHGAPWYEGEKACDAQQVRL